MRIGRVGLGAFILVFVSFMVSGLGANGRTIPFSACQSSSTWTRPSEEQQRAEVWSRSRYSNVDEARLQPQLYEQFFEWGGGNSELFDEYPLHGLWSATDTHVVDDCYLGSEVGPAAGQYVDLFLLNHRALSVKVDGSTYRVMVEPTQAGFQHIEFKRVFIPDPAMSWPFKIKITDQGGLVLASFADCTPSKKGTPC